MSSGTIEKKDGGQVLFFDISIPGVLDLRHGKAFKNSV
jgi:hypothetical protein